MGITDILSLLGGLALFLFGMQTMSNGLEAAAGNKMKSILEKLTSNRIMGVFVGAVITAVIQSSSATTVMVVGFVNSGLMTLNQAVWIIMGANIGTTITGQLIALDIGAIAPLFAIIGVGAIMFSKSEKVHHISGIIAGLGILFIGMDMMGAAMEPLQESEAFLNLMTQFSNPLLGIESAVYVLFGQNIGTCITAVLASIGTKVNARRTTVIHLMFNIIGTTIFTIICMTTPYVHLVESITPGDPVAQIANAHTIFNIVTTLILLPFGNYMARAAERILPDSKKEDDEDLRLKYIRPFDSSYSVGNSAIAVTQVKDEVNRMLDMVSKNIGDAFDTLIKYDEKSRQKVEEREEYIDYLNKGISEYIVSLMSGEMNADDSRKINGYYAIISNLERIGDHATNIAEYADDMKKWDLQFSDNVLDELEEMKKQCIASLKNLKNADSGDAQKVLSQAEILEQQTDDMRDKYFKKQMQRLKKGKCKPQSGIVFSEVLTDFERMGDHALNIAQQYKEMG